VAPERGSGEGDLEVFGDSVSPSPAAGPRGQVLATGLAEESGRGARRPWGSRFLSSL
jgi:hypothetical protein